MSEIRKSDEILAEEVNNGLWGKGAEIKRRLIQAGRNPFPILALARQLKTKKEKGHF